MKRKAQPKAERAAPAAADSEVVVPEVMKVEILPASTFYPPAVRASTVVPCVVCAGETRSDLTEQLCWVCRRLKISAWRDSEPMPAQE